MSTDITTSSTSTSLVKRAGLIALFAVLALLMGAKFSGALISGPSSSGHSSAAAYSYGSQVSTLNAATATTATDTTGSGTVTFSWTTPSITVGITQYQVIDLGANGTSTPVVLCTAPGAGAPSATDSCTYTGTAVAAGDVVKVYSQDGTAADAVASNPYDQTNVIAAPGAVTQTPVTVGNATLTFNYSVAPGNNTSLKNSGAKIYDQNNNVVCTTTSLTKCVVTASAAGYNTANPGTYIYTVKVFNDFGSASSGTQTASPVAYPGAFTATAAVNYATGYVNISWTAAAPGTGTVAYTVATSGAGTCASTTTLSCKIAIATIAPTNPFNGTITVTATNTAQATSTAVTSPIYVAVVPAVPAAVSSSYTTNGSAMTVVFNGNATSAEADVAGYNLQLVTCTATASPSATTCTNQGSPIFVGAVGTASNVYTKTNVFSGLTVGTIYDYTVSSVGKTGVTSAAVYGVAATDAITTPGAPTVATATVLAATATNSSFVASWTAPVNIGGTAIVGYQVVLYSCGTNATTYCQTVVTKSSATIGNVSTYTFKNLTPGYYYYTVAADNTSVATGAGGSGLGSTASSTVIAVGNGAVALAVPTATYTAAGVTFTATGLTNIATYTIADATAPAVSLCTMTVTASGVGTCSIAVAALKSTHSYEVVSTDASGQVVTSTSVTVGVPTGTITPVSAHGNSTVGILVKWTNSSTTGVVGYNIIATDKTTGATITATAAKSATSYLFPASSLSASDTYGFQFNAYNAFGGTTYTAVNGVTAAVTEEAGVPTAPVAGTGTGTTTFASTAGSAQTSGVITAYWTETNANDTSNPVTSFTVTVTSAYTGNVVATTTVDATATSATIKGLLNGISYKVTVVANGALGNSTATSLGSAVAIPTEPAAPTAVTATPTDGTGTTETITWTNPTNNGGVALYGAYVTVTNKTTGDTATPAACSGTTSTDLAVIFNASKCLVTGLTAGDSYLFSVYVLNLQGYTAVATLEATLVGGNAPYATALATAKTLGYVSTAGTLTTSTPSAPTAAPTAVAATVSGQKVTITWIAPAANGGSAILGYVITASAGLTPASCTSPNGTDTFAIAGHVVTTTGTDTSVTCTISGNSATVAQSATFTVYAYNGVGTHNGATLTKGAGASPISAKSNAVSLYALPAEPTSVNVMCTTSMCELAWSGGDVGDTYSIVATGSTATTVTTSNKYYDFTSFTSSGVYTFVVSSVNAAGSTVQTTPAPLIANIAGSGLVTTVPTYTGSVYQFVQDASTTQASTSIILAWDALSTGVNGSSSLHPVTYRIVGVGTSNSVVIDQVTSATTLKLPYVAGETFTLYVVDAAGASIGKTFAAGDTYTDTAAVAPSDPSATVTSTSSATTGLSTATFAVTPGTGTDVTSTTVAITGQTSVAVVAGAAVFSKLAPATTYTYTVTTCNPVGCDTTPATGSFTTPAAVPSAVTSVATAQSITAAGHISVVVSWATPISNGGSPITTYIVDYTNGTLHNYCLSVLTATSTSCAIDLGTTGLSGNWYATVVAYNIAGGSAVADNTGLNSYNATTYDIPLASPIAVSNPASVTVTSGGAYSLVVTWSETNASSIPVTGFTAKATGADGTSATCTAAATATTCTITGLTNQAYTTGVVANAATAALSSSSVAPASDWSLGWTAPTQPAVILGGASKVGGTASVLFSAPVATAGAADSLPTTYSAQAYTAAGVAVGSAVACTASPCTVTGLGNATAYTIVLTPLNAVGTGKVTSSVVVTTLSSSAPSAVTGLGAVRTANGLSVSWTAPASIGSAAQLVGYWVSATDALSGQQYTCPYNATYGVLLAPSVSCNITGLTVGNSYTVSVTAIAVDGALNKLLSAATTASVTYNSLAPAPVKASFTGVATLSAATKSALNNLISTINDGAKITVTGYGTTKAIALARANAAVNYLFNNGAAIHYTIKTVISKTNKTAVLTVTSN